MWVCIVVLISKNGAIKCRLVGESAVFRLFIQWNATYSTVLTITYITTWANLKKSHDIAQNNRSYRSKCDSVEMMDRSDDCVSLRGDKGVISCYTGECNYCHPKRILKVCAFLNIKLLLIKMFSIYTAYFYANLTWAKIMWEEGTSIKKILHMIAL